MTTYAERLEGTGAVWRTARKRHYCKYLHRERIAINPGERYLDTAEIDGDPFHTIKLCAACANAEVK